MLLLSASASKNKSFSQESAISLVKRTTASMLDPALPRRAFAGWVEEKFQDWRIDWEMNDCSQIGREIIFDGKRDIPTCVQLNLAEPGRERSSSSTNGFQIFFLVGTQNKGLLSVPLFRTALRVDEDRSEVVTRLSEVEP